MLNYLIEIAAEVAQHLQGMGLGRWTSGRQHNQAVWLERQDNTRPQVLRLLWHCSMNGHTHKNNPEYRPSKLTDRDVTFTIKPLSPDNAQWQSPPPQSVIKVTASPKRIAQVIARRLPEFAAWHKHTISQHERACALDERQSTYNQALHELSGWTRVNSGSTTRFYGNNGACFEVQGDGTVTISLQVDFETACDILQMVNP